MSNSRKPKRNTITTISEKRRREILSLPKSGDVHSSLLRQMPFLEKVQISPPKRSCPPLNGPVRVFAWNAERCKHLSASVKLFDENRADIYLLTEMDWGMARSKQRHTTLDLARALDCGFIFAVEFLELGLGDEEERRCFEGKKNRVGYHGASLLSPHPFHNSRVVRLETQGDWFDGRFGERRVGGRIGLLGTVIVSGKEVTFASVHLESESDPDFRCRQMGVLLDAIEQYYPGAPAVIAGDLNTFSIRHEDLHNSDRLKSALQKDPGRFVNPIPYEPLFSLAKELGYEWEHCNDITKPTVLKPSLEGGLKIDWFLCRGVHAEHACVIPARSPDTGRPISDHEALAVTISVM
jgi:endonuclease/exonuclease/phosphatase family metal-dependent hydrolase